MIINKLLSPFVHVVPISYIDFWYLYLSLNRVGVEIILSVWVMLDYQNKNVKQLASGKQVFLKKNKLSQ